MRVVYLQPINGKLTVVIPFILFSSPRRRSMGLPSRLPSLALFSTFLLLFRGLQFLRPSRHALVLPLRGTTVGREVLPSEDVLELATTEVPPTV